MNFILTKNGLDLVALALDRLANGEDFNTVVKETGVTQTVSELRRQFSEELLLPIEQKKFPLQPIGFVGNVIRFRPNAVVMWLLDNKTDMNELARQGFPPEDRAQFASMIGYSVSGWGDLSYVFNQPELLESADAIASAIAKERKG